MERPSGFDPPPGLTPETLRIHLLGGFRVHLGSRVIPDADWRRSKVRSLLKLLALAPSQRLHRDHLYEILWPDLDRTAADNNLRRALHIARHALQPNAEPPFRFLRLQRDLLILAPDTPLWVDVAAFEAAAAAARRTRDPAGYEAVITLYSGELLPEDVYEEWTTDRRHTLYLTYLDLLHEVSRLYLEMGELGAAIAALRRLATSEPTDEQARYELMRLYALIGRPHRALAEYADLAQVLQRELEITPRPATRELHEAIRAGKFRSGDTKGDRLAARGAEFIVEPCAGRGADESAAVRRVTAR